MIGRLSVLFCHKLRKKQQTSILTSLFNLEYNIMARNDAKLEWLRAVFETKETLFGAFSDKLTKPDKVNAWKAMHSKAQALALVPNNKDYMYTRDTFWQNLRKNAMKKRDNSRATGTGTFIGLPVPESSETLSEAAPNPSTQVDTSSCSSMKHGRQRGSVSVRQAKRANEKLLNLKVKKMSLMISLLQKENYLKDLKIKLLERTLNEPHREVISQNVAEVVSSDDDDFEVDYLDDLDI